MKKKLRIIWGSLVVYTVVFLIIAKYIQREFFAESYQHLGYIFQIISLALLAIGILYSRYIMANQVRKLEGELGLRKEKYMKLSIISLALMEGAIFLIIIAYMLTGLSNLFLLSAIGILLLLMQYPSDARIAADLKVERDETDTL